MSYQVFTNSRKIRVCPISAFWLLLTALLAIVILSSCSNQRSISRSYTKPLDKTLVSENEDKNTSNEFNQLLAEAKKKSGTKIKNKSIQNSPTQEDSVSNSDQVGEILLPKFDDLLKTMSQDLASVKSDITHLKNDNVEIKSSLEEIKDALRHIYEKNKRAAYVGEVPPQTTQPATPQQTTAKNRTITSEEHQKQLPETPKRTILSNESLNSTTSNTQKTTSKNSNQQEEKPMATASQNSQTQNTTNDIRLTSALGLIKDKNYKQAINELIAILNNTNDGNLKGSTQYYLGESHLNLKNYDKAIDSYKNVLKSPKTDLYDDSQYKIANAYYQKGDNSIAKMEFQTLVKKYPTSQYLPFARKMLQQL